MSWRTANSLETLLAQVNRKWPGRRKDSDGSIGDTAHSSRTSDHNPNGRGVVCARDFTHDLGHGLDARKLAETLITSGDRRLHYAISNGEIANMDIDGGRWRPYKGSNPHRHHCHISVRQDSMLYDNNSPWNIDGVPVKIETGPVLPTTLRRGARTEQVKELQGLLNLPIDGHFGPKTEAAVRVFQQKHGLIADGIVGPMTWAKLKEN